MSDTEPKFVEAVNISGKFAHILFADGTHDEVPLAPPRTVGELRASWTVSPRWSCGRPGRTATTDTSPRPVTAFGANATAGYPRTWAWLVEAGR